VGGGSSVGDRDKEGEEGGSLELSERARRISSFSISFIVAHSLGRKLLGQSWGCCVVVPDGEV